MILTCAVGWALEHFAGWSGTLMIGLLLGLIVAPMIPTKNACPLQRKPDAS